MRHILSRPDRLEEIPNELGESSKADPSWSQKPLGCRSQGQQKEFNDARSRQPPHRAESCSKWRAHVAALTSPLGRSWPVDDGETVRANEVRRSRPVNTHWVNFGKTISPRSRERPLAAEPMPFTGCRGGKVGRRGQTAPRESGAFS